MTKIHLTPERISITPAELKTLREKWGLSTQWLADQAGVRVRTVQYWESGRSAVPEDVAAIMLVTDMRLESIIDASVEFVTSLDPIPENIVLVRYKSDEDLHRYRPDMSEFSARAHGMVLALTKSEIEIALEDVNVRIVYLEPEQYEAWLKLTNQKDSEQTRAAWAGTLEI